MLLLLANYMNKYTASQKKRDAVLVDNFVKY